MLLTDNDYPRGYTLLAGPDDKPKYIVPYLGAHPLYVGWPGLRQSLLHTNEQSLIKHTRRRRVAVPANCTELLRSYYDTNR